MKRLALLFGLALCFAGGFLVKIELIAQPSYTLADRLNDGQAVNNDDLWHEIKQQERLSASGWKDADFLKNVALSEYALGASNNGYTSNLLLQSAINNLSQGLALSPVDPVAWYRLALLRISAGASGEDICRALHMSLLTGPIVSQLISPRLKLALTYWDYLDESDKKLFMAQVRILKRWDPQEAAKLAQMSERNQLLFSTP